MLSNTQCDLTVLRADVFKFVLDYYGGNLGLVNVLEISKVMISLGIEFLYFFFNKNGHDTIVYLTELASCVLELLTREEAFDKDMQRIWN